MEKRAGATEPKGEKKPAGARYDEEKEEKWGRADEDGRAKGDRGGGWWVLGGDLLAGGVKRAGRRAHR